MSGTEEVEQHLAKLTVEDEDARPRECEVDSWETLFADEEAVQRVETKSKNNVRHKSNKEKEKGDAPIDYYSMKATDLKSKESPKHTGSLLPDWVVEVYNFHRSVKTADIVSQFCAFKAELYAVKWVDDTHALVIFANKDLAERALAKSYQIFKLRTMEDAFPSSVSIALNCAERLRPVVVDSPKPKTTSSVARRMISSALGVRVKVSSEQLKSEREAIQKAKEEKKNTAQQKKDYWNDSD